MEEILADEDLIAGMSPAFGDLLALKRYCKLAGDAAAVGKRLNGGKSLIPFETAIPYLVVSNMPPGEMDDFHEPGYDRLAAYDKAHGTQLEETLMAFLGHACSISQAAGALFIHRNTMAQRMERIAEIGQLDLSDGAVLFRCHLTSIIRAWQESGEDS